MIKSMPTVRDRILVVESDPLTADLIGRQALQASGYQVLIVNDANAAISKAIQWAPDLVITSINLPGLSGKDLMVALTSQGVQTPVILIAQRGQEADIMQTFRLGASDYLMLPVREAEVIAAVERVLKQVHERRERERLSQQLQQTNQEMQQRVRELTTIFAVGKAVTSITDSNLLFEKILDGAIKVTQADLGWFMMRDDVNRPFTLAAASSLPPSLTGLLGQVWDDGISSLVGMSGESLSIHGEPLKRFKIYSLGQSALIAPIRVQKQVIGVLAMMRRAATPFGTSEMHLLEALADYGSISLVNARLFRAAEERAHSLQSLAETAVIGEKINNDILRVAKKELTSPVETSLSALSRLGKDPTAHWRPEQRQLLATIHDSLETLHQVVDTITPLQLPQGLKSSAQTNLNDLIRQSVRHSQTFAQQSGLSVITELPPEPVMALAEPALTGQVLDGLMSNAVKFSNSGGQIILRLEKTPDRHAHVTVRNVGVVMDAKATEEIFKENFRPDSAAVQRFGGLGIRLSLIKDIITRQGGKIWLESQPGKGTTFHISLPMARSA